MISWPSLVKLDGDDELIYVASENDFQAECSDIILGEDDYLIDSEGDSYSLQSSSHQLSLTKRPEQYSVESVTKLIRNHEFQKAEVCLMKIHFPTIEEAIQSLAFKAR
ncbi:MULTISPECIES: DUF4144 domain-containing protein [Vibrio]|uniref:Uncharacterized protein n=1 Tax=Vibrio lentus TaxID=136468 RepID=A0A1B9Q3H3_9VIBR|nr:MULTISPECIES: DUF4144 domain-containing protein [Vibrio]OCH53768.1 hypothetical protein A6E08_04990 [Vibrio lentus]PME51719.1 hypothetical protein BCV34_09340 [Vibrio lentus]PME56894.1 hypothetical protein BCV30_18120 [Vibrio lentus]PME83943.1 hypothetical protein BCV27_10970 [Vibrio lentus]PMH89879.1 hypothetical protein BCU56_18550 [Vibrio lentus]